MRIGFFGGSFDPPHLGHLAVAEAARKAFGLHRVLLAPVAVQPLKERGSYASYPDRLHMVELLCQNGKGLGSSNRDAPRADGQPNFTVDTLGELRACEPGARLFSIVGMDAFAGFHQWKQPDELLRLAEWIVVSRPGSAPVQLRDAFSADQRRRVHSLASVNVPVSATDIRARLAAGRSCADLVPEPVLAYIREHHLYGS